MGSAGLLVKASKNSLFEPLRRWDKQAYTKAIASFYLGLIPSRAKLDRS